jgi:hypothetical protein
MTNQSWQKAVKMASDAYKAGVTSTPRDKVDLSHALLETRYLMGLHHAKSAQSAKQV